MSLGNGAMGQSSVGIYYIFVYLSLAESVVIELPWYPFSNPKTHSLERSSFPCVLAYFTIAVYKAYSLASVDDPSYMTTYLIPGGAIGISDPLNIYA